VKILSVAKFKEERHKEDWQLLWINKKKMAKKNDE